MLRKPFAFVQQLGQLPAAIDVAVRSNTGQLMPVEQRRAALYVKLEELGQVAVPALQRGLMDPNVQVRETWRFTW